MPRTPDGRPDLQGNWSSATLTPLERPRDQGPVLSWDEVERLERRADGYIERVSRPSDPNRPAPPQGGDGSTGGAGNVGGYNGIYMDRGSRVAVVNGEPRSSLITQPADGRVPPRTPEAQAEAAEYREFRSQFAQYDHPEVRGLGERCIMPFGSSAGPPMIPNTAYNNNYQIFQTPDFVAIVQEHIHDVRFIPLDGRPHIPGSVRQYAGDSRGRWEGDTLVVETTHFNEHAFIRNFTSNLSTALHVVERFTRVDADTIDYEFTVTDPNTWTRPWSGSLPLSRAGGPMFEYACHEGNYGLTNMLAGSRVQERAEGNR